ncbi:MAG: M20/M25/M40 family metallo-hydrolase [Pseudomonadales bacterium]|nr:M20/M25/M40 family metallo-hydrolase [Pseudomonadales bacterium]
MLTEEPDGFCGDAGYVAMAIATFVRELALKMGGDQVATVGSIELKPNLINVIANSASISVDLRNTDQQLLHWAEQQLAAYIKKIAASEKVKINCKELVRFAPVDFDPQLVNLVEQTALAQGHSILRMPSGAGHDAQSFAPNCPTAMIFVPSVAGISHNITEHTETADIEAGANVLLKVVLQLASG